MATYDFDADLQGWVQQGGSTVLHETTTTRNGAGALRTERAVSTAGSQGVTEASSPAYPDVAGVTSLSAWVRVADDAPAAAGDASNPPYHAYLRVMDDVGWTPVPGPKAEIVKGDWRQVTFDLSGMDNSTVYRIDVQAFANNAEVGTFAVLVDDVAQAGTTTDPTPEPEPEPSGDVTPLYTFATDLEGWAGGPANGTPTVTHTAADGSAAAGALHATKTVDPAVHTNEPLLELFGPTSGALAAIPDATLLSCMVKCTEAPSTEVRAQVRIMYGEHPTDPWTHVPGSASRTSTQPVTIGAWSRVELDLTGIAVEHVYRVEVRLVAFGVTAAGTFTALVDDVEATVGTSTTTDQTAPTVTLDTIHGPGPLDDLHSSPGYNQDADSVTVTGTATDGADADATGVELVEVRIGAAATWHSATDTSGDGSWSTWSVDLPLAQLPPGQHTVEAQASDGAGNVSQRASRSVWHSPDGIYVAAATAGNHLVPATLQGGF